MNLYKKYGYAMGDDMISCQKRSAKDKADLYQRQSIVDEPKLVQTACQPSKVQEEVKFDAVKGAKVLKLVLVGIVVTFLALNVIACSDAERENKNPINTELNSTNEPTKAAKANEDKPKIETLFADVISDEALRIDFINVCEQIGMDKQKIKDLEKADDWVGGTRYLFKYLGGFFSLYCNMDSTVHSVKLGTNTYIYKQGYEPYQVSDYIVDPSVSAALQILSEDYVRSQLNYPSTAVFPLSEWSFSRERDLYSVISKVTAENAFGVKDELAFRIIYQFENSSAKKVFFELDGSVLINRMDSITIPERKKIDTKNIDQDLETVAIVLIEGELGNYGKTVSLDGFDYINYHVPAGSYTVINNGKWCKVYLAKDDYYKNSDGYMDNVIVETFEFSSYGESKTIFVSSGEHLELTINANVTLTPND